MLHPLRSGVYSDRRPFSLGPFLGPFLPRIAPTTGAWLTSRSPWRGDLDIIGPNKAFGQMMKSYIWLFDLGYLVEAKGNWGFAFKDRDQHDQLLGVDLNLRDRGRQRLEWTFLDDDRIANLEVHRNLRSGFLCGFAFEWGTRFFSFFGSFLHKRRCQHIEDFLLG